MFSGIPSYHTVIRGLKDRVYHEIFGTNADIEYPGNFQSKIPLKPLLKAKLMANLEAQDNAEKHYQRRMFLWFSSEKKAAKAVLCAAFKGFKARKETAHTLRKDRILNDAKNRVRQAREQTQILKDKHVELEQEMALLREMLRQQDDKIKTYKMLNEVEKLQHSRQVHHLRNLRTKLISGVTNK